MMKTIQADLLQGTLDLLVLKTLQTGPRHGWDIAQRIQQISQDVLRVGQGSLYPALHRLEDRGLIDSEWGVRQQQARQVLQADLGWP
jgi:PadR family transcriptional regulator PadR